jgi:RNA polymerase sigma factor (sigma-70 family)
LHSHASRVGFMNVHGAQDRVASRSSRRGNAALGSLTSLVERARGGDSAAWNGIVDRFAGLVWAVARRHGLCNADAADVSQTTWLRLVENLDRVRDPERVGGWLATTARHEALRVLRISDRQVPSAHEELTDLVTEVDDDPIDGNLLTDERDRELWELIALLPPRCQVLLTALTEASELSYVEIGQALDMPTGSIGPTRARCLEHLRRLAARRGITSLDSVS